MNKKILKLAGGDVSLHLVLRLLVEVTIWDRGLASEVVEEEPSLLLTRGLAKTKEIIA